MRPPRTGEQCQIDCGLSTAVKGIRCIHRTIVTTDTSLDLVRCSPDTSWPTSPPGPAVPLETLRALARYALDDHRELLLGRQRGAELTDERREELPDLWLQALVVELDPSALPTTPAIWRCAPR